MELENDKLNINLDEESITHEEALGKIALMLGKTENNKILTELSHNDVLNIVRISTTAKILNMDYLNNLCEEFRLHMVSLDRKGRKEIENIAMEMRRLPNKQGFWNRLRGNVI